MIFSRKVKLGLILGVVSTVTISATNSHNSPVKTKRYDWIRKQVVLTDLWNRKSTFIDGYLKEHHEVDIHKEIGLEEILSKNTGCWCQNIIRNKTYKK